MAQKDITIVRAFKKNLEKKISIKKMIFFGSRVHGKTHKWSDFDILIVSPEFKGKKSFERGIGFYKHWKEDKPVDFLCYSPEEFEYLKKRITLVKAAVEEGIEI